MLLALYILFALFLVVCLGILVLLITPVRIYGMASGDLYNGGAGLDVKVLPFGGALGAGVLRPEGGTFSLWLYVFGYRLLKLPLPKEKSGGEEWQDTKDIFADFEIDETVEPIDIEDVSGSRDVAEDRIREARIEYEPSTAHDAAEDAEPPSDKAQGAGGETKDSSAEKPKKPLMERLRNLRENAGKYWRWAKTAFGDLWYIVRIRLLAGQVTIGLLNHPATVGSIMGAFAAINAVLPRPFRITVRSEFTRTALDGRVEAEISVYLHRVWITLVRRRKMIFDVWREYRHSGGDEAEVLGVEDSESGTEATKQSVHAM